MKNISLIMCSIFLTVLLTCTITSAKGPGGGGGGTGGGGGGKDVTTAPDYGDLVVIYRDDNGVPILSDAGCVQPLDIDGEFIPLDEECEMLEGSVPVEVDFGRLNIARSPVSVIDNRFDEVIWYIKASTAVSLDPAGRLQLKMESDMESFSKTIDAPLECLALYKQIMKYGHLQTKGGVISSDHGDEIVYRPVLESADYLKFSPELAYLLPTESGSTVAEPPSVNDMLFSSFFLAGAGDKTGWISVDLVQYMNAILGIPNATNAIDAEKPSFLDFSAFEYNRTDNFSVYVPVILPEGTPGLWKETEVSLLEWLSDVNANLTDNGSNIAGFVNSANESLQVIGLMHEYAIPADPADLL